MANISILDGGLGQEIQKRSRQAAHPLWSVKVMLENIEQWREAPVWDEDSIKDATKDWFKYLN